MNKIFYIMGKSSSGKDSIFKEIKKTIPYLKEVVPYTTRPIRAGEKDGREYYFVNEETLREMEEKGCVIEKRVYNTRCGIWKYFTADDGQIVLKEESYLMIGTLESYISMCRYYGVENMVPLYVEVEDGLRLSRALERERQQSSPKYEELCRRFLADSLDFSEENLKKAGIEKRFQNREFKQCVLEICEYIQKEKFSSSSKEKMERLKK